MQYILSLLPVLACPVGVGLLMWFMMRSNDSNKDQMPGDGEHVRVDTAHSVPAAAESPQKTSWLSLLGMCLNWKVVAGLAVIGLLVLVVAPQIGWLLLPVLLIAACPLSMLFMMRGMRGMQGGMGRPSSQPASASPVPVAEAAREEQLTALRTQLLSIQAEQEAIAGQITQLEREDTGVSSYLEAEDADSSTSAERREALPKW